MGFWGGEEPARKTRGKQARRDGEMRWDAEGSLQEDLRQATKQGEMEMRTGWRGAYKEASKQARRDGDMRRGGEEPARKTRGKQARRDGEMRWDAEGSLQEDLRQASKQGEMEMRTGWRGAFKEN